MANGPARSDGSSHRNNHYVPQWYQRRFLSGGSQQLHYLTLQPQYVMDDTGRRRQLPERRRRSVRDCFVERDLYSLQFGSFVSTRIEREFFGDVDRNGAAAVNWWSRFDRTSFDRTAVAGLLDFMSSQKLRTPKGLAWIGDQLRTDDPAAILGLMTQWRSLFSSIWAEAVWALVDATNSPTKFIVTDHPVTVYNRTMGPRHEKCRGANDPDIRLHASHTIFPLDLNRALVLTNSTWATNPYRAPNALRPNPHFFRNTMFNLLDVQLGRRLTEEEVRQVNFILKSRALRYIAAGEEEWLYPEREISKSDWSIFGHGYLLMPEPRVLHVGGEVVMGYSDGSAEAYDSFGRRPWDPDYAATSADELEHRSLRRFRDEFAALFGRDLRGADGTSSGPT